MKNKMPKSLQQITAPAENLRISEFGLQIETQTISNSSKFRMSIATSPHCCIVYCTYICLKMPYVWWNFAKYPGHHGTSVENWLPRRNPGMIYKWCSVMCPCLCDRESNIPGGKSYPQLTCCLILRLSCMVSTMFLKPP